MQTLHCGECFTLVESISGPFALLGSFRTSSIVLPPELNPGRSKVGGVLGYRELPWVTVGYRWVTDGLQAGVG